MKVRELNREQLNELKQFYYLEVKGQNYDMSYEELEKAKEISDEDIYKYYYDTSFVNDDFFCSNDCSNDEE